MEGKDEIKIAMSNKIQDLKRRIEQALRSGDLEKVRELKKELNKLIELNEHTTKDSPNDDDPDNEL